MGRLERSVFEAMHVCDQGVYYCQGAKVFLVIIILVISICIGLTMTNDHGPMTS